MVESLRKLKHSKIDQECLVNNIKQWKFKNPPDTHKEISRCHHMGTARVSP